jgi:hypothetical protein
MARIGDREVGPFVIDTGASDLFFDVELAKSLKLSFWGEDEDPDIKQKIKFSTVASFEVGPLTLQNTRVVVIDLSSMTALLGERLAGVLGYPFFAKPVIEVDYPKTSISCFDPKHYRLPRGAWQPLTLKRDTSYVRDHYFVPTLTARLEGHVEGLFLLDTGSGSTVRFLPDFVQKHALLDNRAVRQAKSFRVSGESEELAGKLAWFDLAGYRFKEPTVRFMLPNTPQPKRPEGLAGIIGQGLMRAFIVVFNYPESKIAFLRK